jgi:hypothetical protein
MVNSKPIVRRINTVSVTPSSTSFLQKNLLQQIARLNQIVSAFPIQENEPKISQHQHRDGSSYWRIYDPITNQIVTLFSEREVRVWLEQRYYQ